MHAAFIDRSVVVRELLAVLFDERLCLVGAGRELFRRLLVEFIRGLDDGAGIPIQRGKQVADKTVEHVFGGGDHFAILIRLDGDEVGDVADDADESADEAEDGADGADGAGAAAVEHVVYDLRHGGIGRAGGFVAENLSVRDQAVEQVAQPRESRPR